MERELLQPARRKRRSGEEPEDRRGGRGGGSRQGGNTKTRRRLSLGGAVWGTLWSDDEATDATSRSTRGSEASAIARPSHPLQHRSKMADTPTSLSS